MRKVNASFFVIATLLFSLSAITGFSQGRGHGRGNGHGHHKHDRDNRDARDDRGDRGNHNHHYDRRDGHGGHHYYRDYGYSSPRHHHGRHPHHARVQYRPVYVHTHHHGCDHRVVVRHCDRPRYVYYSDYDVYYDFQREVYISYSGRNWTVSASLPVFMHGVDIRRVECREVRYYDDDFVTYLHAGRPMYGGVYVRN